MRVLFAIFAALLASFVLFPTTASAGQITFIGRCPACGTPMYGQTIVAGYNRYGQPIVQTVPVGHSCRGLRNDYGRGGHHGDHHNGYRSQGYGDYGHGRSSGYTSRPRSGFSISIFR